MKTFALEKAVKVYGRQSLSILEYIRVKENIAAITNLSVDYNTKLDGNFKDGMYKLIGNDLHFIDNMSIEEYPKGIKLDLIDETKTLKFEINLETLKNLSLHCSKDYRRVIMEGIYYSVINDSLYMVATDGNTILSKVIDKVDKSFNGLSGIISSEMIKIVLKSSVKNLHGEIYSNGITFTDSEERFKLTAKNIDETYPDFLRAINQQINPIRELIVNKKDINDSLKELESYAKNTDNIITFGILDKYIEIMVGGEFTKKVIVTCENNIIETLNIDPYNINMLMPIRTPLNKYLIEGFEYDKADTEQSFSFNIKLLVKILKSINSDYVRIIQNAPLKGFIFEEYSIK